MVNQVKVKCFMTLDGSPPMEEIRLFKVDAESTTVYDDLLAKLMDCYKDAPYAYSMTWTDSENDEIKVSSNGELQAAFEELAEKQTLKMKITGSKTVRWGGYYNKMKKNKNSGKIPGMKIIPNYENPNMIHPGVTCDGCEGPIMGARWKCNTCPDFDLCVPCKRKGTHSQHVFIKIPFRLRNWRYGLPLPIGWAGVVCPGERKGTQETTETEVLTACDVSDDDDASAMDQDLMTFVKEGEDKGPTSSTMETDDAGSLADVTEDLYISDNMIGDSLKSRVEPEQPVQDNASDNEFVLLNCNSPEPKTRAGEGTPEVSLLYPSIPAEEPAPPTPSAPSTFTPPPVSAPSTSSLATPPPPAPDSASPISTLSLPPNIIGALSCMLDMGYTNSGEWLAKLLLHKNGDINAVIDILNAKPVRR